MFGRSGVASYTYTSSPTCTTTLRLLSGDEGEDELQYRETPVSGQSETECASGYVTFKNITSTRMRWEWRQNLTDTSYAAFGTVTKN
jgi:hypothetical protein